MEIMDVEIAPESPAHVTPLELLEDFADVVPNWHFLEEDSRLYAAIRGCDACVIRVWNEGRAESVDYAFAAASNADPLTLRLVILCPPNVAEPVVGADRNSCLQHFLRAFTRYVEARGTYVRVKPIRAPSAETIEA